MPYARVPTDPAGAPANTVRACVGDQIYRPARFPGDVGGAVHHMRAVVRIPQTMADRSGHLAARSARTWARLRVWNSCPNRCSSRSWRQTPRLPAKSCGPTSMTSPAGTTAGRRRMDLFIRRLPAVVPAGDVIDVGPQDLAGSRGVWRHDLDEHRFGQEFHTLSLAHVLAERAARCPDRSAIVCGILTTARMWCTAPPTSPGNLAGR